MRTIVASAARHVREPLFLHAYALALSGVLTSGLGVIYWAVAARTYPAEIVGVNATLLSLVTLLGNVSQLNLRSGFGRFVPVAGAKVGGLLGAGYLASAALAVASSVVVVGILSAIPSIAPVLTITAPVAGLFIVTTVAWTLFGLQDHALTALRRTVWVPVENALFAVLKIGLLVALAGVAGTFAIVASWAIPMLVLVAVVTTWIFRAAVPAYRRSEVRDPPRANAAPPVPVSIRSVTSYVGVDYAGSLFSIASSALLPVIVLSLLGAVSSAHFYIVALVASAAELLPTVLATSLLVESASSAASFERDGRRVLRQIALLVVPVIVVVLAGAPLILGIFGVSYAEEGSTALRLFALSGIPFALIQLSFIRLRLERRVRWVLATQALLAAANVAGCIILLPRLGLAAAGLTSLVAESVAAVFLVRAHLWGVVLGPRRPPSPEAASTPGAGPPSEVQEHRKEKPAGA